MRFVAGFIIVVLCAFSAAADTEVAVLLDTDHNASTGCSVITADGLFQGAERRLVAVVATHLPQPAVVSLRVQNCIDASTNAFGPLADVQARSLRRGPSGFIRPAAIRTSSRCTSALPSRVTFARA
jgi:hypothetical protein